MEAIEAATHAQAPAGNVYGLGAETPSRRRVTDDVFDMGVVRGRDRNSLSRLNLSFDLYPSPWERGELEERKKRRSLTPWQVGEVQSRPFRRDGLD